MEKGGGDRRPLPLYLLIEKFFEFDQGLHLFPFDRGAKKCKAISIFPLFFFPLFFFSIFFFLISPPFLGLIKRIIRRRLVLGIADGKISFHPAVAPDSVIEIEMGKVDRLRFASADEETAPGAGDTLRLRDGSTLFGALVQMTEAEVSFDLEHSGVLKFPRAAVEEIVRSAVGVPDVSADAEFHVIVTTAGDVASARVVSYVIRQ